MTVGGKATTKSSNVSKVKHPSKKTEKTGPKSKSEEDLQVHLPESEEDENDDDAKKKKLKSAVAKLKKKIMPKFPPMDQRAKLSPNTILSTAKNKYEVVKLLGAGGFGDVYKILKIENGKDKGKGGDDDDHPKKKFYALKTENCEIVVKGHNRLKVEMAIFQAYAEQPKERKLHFVEMIDKGRTEKFKFIVMDLVGKSIDRIQKKMPERRFSLRSSIKIALQTLDSICDLHEIGYIHRDIKPQNFTFGLGDNVDNIYLLDFGIARQFTVKGGKAIRLPREKVAFLGTIRYASRNCHNSKEQCRRDDLESWIYMFAEFIDYSNGLPWIKIKERNGVCASKEAFFSGSFSKSLKALPEEIPQSFLYVNTLGYADAPDYSYIRTMLRQAADKRDLDIDAPFEFTRKKKRDCVADASLDELAWIL